MCLFSNVTDTLSSGYLLLDSIPLGELNENDKKIIFSNLKLFHNSTNDTVQVKALESICENLNHPIWEEYERYTFEFIQNRLKSNNNPQEIKRLKRALSDAYNNLGYIETISGNLNDAIKFFKESIKYSNEIDNEKGTSDTYNNLGYIFNLKGEIDSAIAYYNKALFIRKKYNDSTGIANSYNNLGFLYHNLGQFSLSLEYYFKALKLRELLKDNAGLANTYNNIGNIFKEQEEFDKALEYFFKTLDLKLTLNDRYGVADIYSNIGTVYFLKEDFQEALKFYKMSLKLFKELGKQQKIANGYNKIGEIHLALGSYEEALNYFFNALSEINESEDKSYLAGIYYNIARAYYKKNNLTLAESYAFKAIEKSTELKNVFYIKNAKRLLSEIFEQKNDWKDAYTYYKSYVNLKDSLTNEENNKELFQKELNYKFEKEREIREKEYEKQLAIEKAEQEKKTILLYSSGLGLVLIFAFSVFIFNRLQVTRKQKAIIENQKQIVEQKNKEITDSILYAKRLQKAILPSAEQIKKYLPNSFVYYLPKDIVAGDFYWLETGIEALETTVYFAAADCTGHGVPGAMVSVVCSNALTKAVIEEKITEPGKILDRTRELVIERFAKSSEEVKDGMDISLCAIDFNKMTLQWAGANNPLWIVRKNEHQVAELVEAKPDKQPIGKVENPQPFTTHTIELQKGDTIYIFTDGFADQFGGEKGKKFKYKSFKELLLSIQDKSMDEQKQIIEQTFINWKGELEQVDDVCVIGVRM